ncbi:trypsin-like peptidase domain-containing protein [Kitasatospora sp. NPDC059673]|uniref:VMAP-C domain-containing protein n=1 Tax=Kitasatospora sp. NPDC059673 TaxID=3346901 RepID=UPI00368AEE25
MRKWFSSGRAAEADLLASHVSVLTEAGDQSGAGLYLRDGLVLTCAHVVNDALGRGQFQQDHPGAGSVRIELGRREFEARCRQWIPPRDADGAQVSPWAESWEGDLALLEILGPEPPGTVQQYWQQPGRDQQVRAWFSAESGASFVDSTISSVEPSVAYLDRWGTGPRIGPGYSGGPLWSGGTEAVVGLILGRLRGDGFINRAFTIPWRTIHRELADRLGEAAADKLLPAPAGGTRPAHGRPSDPSARRTAQRTLKTLISGHLKDSVRAQHARAVADACGLTVLEGAGAAPDPDEFAEVLLHTPRGLAAFVESLRDSQDATADLLLAKMPLLGVSALLSPEEYAWLFQQIGEPVAGLPIGLAGVEPLAGVPLPEDLRLPLEANTEALERERLPRLIAHLEGLYRHSSRLVPQLLRFTEYRAAQLAADRPEAAEELRDWGSRVLRRLGIPEAALHEHRALAEQWAERRAEQWSAGRVAVSLSLYERPNNGAPGRYLCHVWAAEPDGSLRLATDVAPEPMPPDAIARRIRSIAAVRGTDAVIEFFLDDHELALPVDTWDGADPASTAGLTSEPLGLRRRVLVRLGRTLSGVDLAERTGSLANRWEYRETPPALHLDETCTADHQVQSVLFRDLTAARVLVRTPGAAVRQRHAALCLHAGIPTVLWDRADPEALPADHYDPLDPDGPHDTLAERVRQYRALVRGDDTAYPLRPVLAQERPDWPAPIVPELFDPEEEPA